MTILQTICILYLFLIISFQLSIVLHELGHLVFGYLSGYTFISFHVFFFVIYKKENHLHFMKQRSLLLRGQCKMRPVSLDSEHFNFTLYTLGGVLFNVIFVCLSLILIIFVKNQIWFYFICTFLAMNAYTALLNAIPYEFIIPNDGLNWVTSRQSAKAKRGVHLMLYLESYFLDGHTYIDFDIQQLSIDVEDDLSNYFIAFIALCKAQYYKQLEEIEQAIEILEKIPYDTLPKYYRIQVLCERLESYIIMEKSPELIQDLYAILQEKQYKRMLSMIRLRCEIAYLFYIEKDEEKAFTQLDFAIKACDKIYNPGIQTMEIQQLEFLKKQFIHTMN